MYTCTGGGTRHGVNRERGERDRSGECVWGGGRNGGSRKERKQKGEGGEGGRRKMMILST